MAALKLRTVLASKTAPKRTRIHSSVVAALNGTEPVQWHRADELKMNHERAISNQRGRGLLHIVLRTFECGRYAAVHDRTSYPPSRTSARGRLAPLAANERQCAQRARDGYGRPVHRILVQHPVRRRARFVTCCLNRPWIGGGVTKVSFSGGMSFWLAWRIVRNLT